MGKLILADFKSRTYHVQPNFGEEVALQIAPFRELSLEAQANAIFAEAFPGVWPEFSQAQSFHGPDKDSA